MGVVHTYTHHTCHVREKLIVNARPNTTNRTLLRKNPQGRHNNITLLRKNPRSHIKTQFTT